MPWERESPHAVDSWGVILSLHFHMGSKIRLKFEASMANAFTQLTALLIKWFILYDFLHLLFWDMICVA